MTISRRLLVAIVVICASIGGQLVLPTMAHAAANAWDFNAGNIIDDSIFTNSSSMTVEEVQQFLNSKTPLCDTWGTQQSEYGGGTRAQYAAARGIPLPFTCLKDYYQNPSTGEDNYGGKPIPAGSISAAQIIVNYARQFNINPQTIIATLQKENGMVTDDWPLLKQYREAVGFGCPDNTAPGAPACDATYGSFSAQIYQAARHFRGYVDNRADWWVAYTTGNNYIRWSPDATCGGSTVYIENRATAALYNYTPYQPNDAAKNAQWGTGDGCSAYGNRNFFLYFTDWFGTTREGVSLSSSLQVKGSTSSTPYINSLTTVSFTVSNSSNYPVNIGSMAVSVRDSTGGNHDFPLRAMIVPAHASVTYQESQVFSSEDMYTFEIVNFSDGQWKLGYPVSSNSTHIRKLTSDIRVKPVLTQGLTLTNGPLQTGKTHTLQFTVKNNSAKPLDLGRFSVAIRGPKGENLDRPLVAASLAAGASKTLDFTFKPTYEGLYSFTIVSTSDNGVSWKLTYPEAANQGIAHSLAQVALPRVVISQSLAMTNVEPRVGQNVSLSYKVKNNSEDQVDLGKIGLWGRDPVGRNVDPVPLSVILAPGEERLMSFSFIPRAIGAYSFGTLSTNDNGVTWGNGPSLMSSSVLRTVSFAVKTGLAITSSVQVKSGIGAAYVGQVDSLQYSVKNYGVESIDLGKIGLWGRDPVGRNVDPGLVAVVLAPGEERVISFPVSFTRTGKYSFGTLQTLDSGRSWTFGPVSENNALKTFDASVTQGVFMTQSITLLSGVSGAHAGQADTISYTIKNPTATTIDLGKIGLWGRDPVGRNVDPGLVAVVLAPGEERVISFPVSFTMLGNYKFGALSTVDNGATWSYGPPVFSSAISNTRDVTVSPSATVSISLKSGGTSLSVGYCDVLTYSVKNFSATTIDLGKIGLWGRDPVGRNVDPGLVATVLASGEEKSISMPICYATAGTYAFGVLSTVDNGRTWLNSPLANSSNVTTTLSLTVH